MYTTIISAENLNSIIDEKNLILFDSRFDLLNKNLGLQNYQKKHIKNAHYVDLEVDLSQKISSFSGRHPLPNIKNFSKFLNNFNITDNSQIIIYDDNNGSMSARMWWMLKLVGLKNCAVLDGGFKIWLKNKYPVDNIIPTKEKLRNRVYSYRTEYIITTDELREKIKSQSICIIDARDKERFLGTEEPIDKKAGHIPGAFNMPFKNNLKSDGKFKSKSEIKNNFSKFFDGNSKQIINMCGSGVTACHNVLAMEYCGYEERVLYVGSWSAWSSHEENKIESK